ncbi:MAG: hypothetical protein H0T60_03495, partial [Acidobacteria bacterium]|nr:hypothetical protein [Acidobacteriota bacterium]
MKRSQRQPEDEPGKGLESRPPQSGEGTGARSPTHTAAARATLASRLEAARALLDRGLSREAEAQLAELIKDARHEERLVAEARCALAEARAMGGHFNDSLAAIRIYESPESRR